MKEIQKYFILFILIIATHSFSQSSISGYVDDIGQANNDAIVYLMEFNKKYSVSKKEQQIISSTKVDSNGYFSFTSDLPKSPRFYYVSVEKKNRSVLSKRFLLSNGDSVFFRKSIPLLSFYQTNSTSDKEFKKLINFSNQIQKKSTFLDDIRSYTKDSLQILAVKLISLKELEKKQLLDKDIVLNKRYYAALLEEFKESNINPSEYLFFELKLAKFQIAKVEEDYMISKSLNILLFVLIVGVLLYFYRFRNPKEELVSLSKQELAIKNLILKQKTNKEIASELFISVSTVKTHITNIYKKLQVVNRAELLLKFKNSTGTSI